VNQIIAATLQGAPIVACRTCLDMTRIKSAANDATDDPQVEVLVEPLRKRHNS
jgi:hypothetical protein